MSDLSDEDIYEGVYKLTKGAVDNKGGRYEWKMATLLFLRGLNHTQNFQLATNDMDAGKFDDLNFCFRPQSGGPKKRLVMQLKHKVDEDCTVHRDKLAVSKIHGKKNPFYLKDYFKSYCDIQNKYKETCYFILFSNASVQRRPSTCDVNIDPEVYNILNTGGNQGYFCTFDVDADEDISHCFEHENDALVRTFLSKFIMFCNQVSERQLPLLILQEVVTMYKRLVPEINEVARDLTKNIEIFWERKKDQCEGQYLTKNWKTWKDINMGVKSKDSIYCQIQFDEVEANSFGRAIVDSTHVVIDVHFGVQCTEMRSLKVLQSLKRQDCSFLIVGASDSMDNLDAALELWAGSQYDVLAIDVGTGADKREAFSSRLCEILQDKSTERKKLVLMSENGDGEFVQALKERLENHCNINTPLWTSIKTTCELRQFSEESQTSIFQTNVEFQGHKQKLDALAQTHVLREILKGQELVTFLNPPSNHVIGRPIQDDYELYMKRKLGQHITVKKEFLQFSHETDTIFVTGLAEDTLVNFVSPEQSIELVNEHNCSRYLVFNASRLETLAEQFQYVLNKKENSPLHWLAYEMDSFKWIRSYGDTRNLLQYIDIDEHETDRTNRQVLKIKWCFSDVEDVICGSGRTILIGEPGMGKSVLLTHVATKSKMIWPSHWVIKVELNNVTETLHGIMSCQNASRQDVLNVLANAAAVHKSTCPRLAEALLRNSMETTGKIVVLLDAYDEISPKYNEVVIQILNILVQSRVRKLWITSRPIMQNQLEQVLGVRAFSFQEFTQNQQTELLVNFWSKRSSTANPSELKRAARKILNRTRQDIPLDNGTSICNIPLHIMIMAETYEQRVFSGDIDTKPILVNLPELYSKFIEKKVHIYCKEKLGINSKKQGNEKLIANYHKKCMEDLMKCALYVLLNPTEWKLLQIERFEDTVKEIIKEIKEGEDNAGLIMKVINEKPYFIHQTFAEYFVALWFKQHWENNDKIMEKIIFEPKFDGVRNIFDRILAEKCEIHLAVLNGHVRANSQVWPQDTNLLDSGGRTALHLAVRRDPPYLVGRAVDILLQHQAEMEVRDKLLGYTPLYYAARANAWETVKLLLRKGAVVEDNIAQDVLVEQVLQEAMQRKLISPQEHDQYLCFQVNWPVFNRRMNIFHLATLCGHVECFKHLISKGATLDSSAEKGRTVLHLATEGGNEHIVKLLLGKVHDIQEQDSQGYTPLHLACYYNHARLVKVLLDEFADALHRAEGGRTPLHVSILRGNYDVVNTLLNSGLNVGLDTKDDDGCSPLHLALQHKNEKLVKLIHDTNIKPLKERGQNLLHEAVADGNLQLLCLLLDSSLIVDGHARDNDGYTPIHIAYKNKDKKAVKLLLDHPSYGIQQQSPLQELIEEDNADLIRVLLDSGIDVGMDQPDDDGNTPLHVACAENKERIVVLLKDKGADVSSRTKEGRTPLHVAVEKGHSDIVRLLLDGDTHKYVNSRDYDGQTALHLAARHNHKNVANLLIEKKAQIKGLDKSRRIPLHGASETGSRDVVRLLLGKTFDVGLQLLDRNGHTPLYLACKHGHTNIASDLLTKGAKVMYKTKNGIPFFHEAIKEGNKEVVALLLERGEDLDVNATDSRNYTPLHYACRYGHTAIAKLLIGKGAKVMACTRNGRTPLHEATESGNANLTDLLLDKGANVNATDKMNYTPLHLACINNQKHIVKILLKRGCNLTLGNNKHITPLHEAAKARNVHIVKLLLSTGKCAGINSHSIRGYTPLHLACMHSCEPVARLLLTKGANAMAMTKKMRTPLHEVADAGSFEIASLLRDRDVDVNATDIEGKTPLHLACVKNHKSVVELFLSMDADIEASDKMGKRPLYVAVEGGNEDIVRLLLDNPISIDVNAQDVNHNTPLDIAHACNKGNIFNLLLRNGAKTRHNISAGKKSLYDTIDAGNSLNNCDNDSPDKDLTETFLSNTSSISTKRKSELHSASGQGKSSRVRRLLKDGADVNSRASDDDSTALHEACWAGAAHVVEILIENGAKSDLQDSEGDTPLHVACREGHEKVVKYLVAQDGDLYVQNRAGNTPIMEAHQANHENIYKYLLNVISKREK